MTSMCRIGRIALPIVAISFGSSCSRPGLAESQNLGRYYSPYRMAASGEPYRKGLEGYIAQSDIVLLGRVAGEGSPIKYAMPGDGGHLSDVVPVSLVVDEVLLDLRESPSEHLYPGALISWLVRASPVRRQKSIETVRDDPCLFFLRQTRSNGREYLAHRDAMGRVSQATQSLGKHEIFGNVPHADVLEQVRRLTRNTKVLPARDAKFRSEHKTREGLGFGRVHSCAALPAELGRHCDKKVPARGIALFPLPDIGSYRQLATLVVGSTAFYRFIWQSSRAEESEAGDTSAIGFALDHIPNVQQEHVILHMNW